MVSREQSLRRDMLFLALPVLGSVVVLLVLFVSARRSTEETVRWIRASGGEVSTLPVTWLPLELAEGTLWLQDVIQVDLSRTPVTDEQVERLSEIPSLNVLSLNGPDLTDRGLARLENLPELQYLTLVNCPKLSEPAIRQLKLAHPGLEIMHRGPALLGISGHPHPEGCFVSFVKPHSAADEAGLRSGDVITRFEKQPIVDFDQLVETIAKYQPGEEVELVVLRAGSPGEERAEIRLRATLGKW